MTVNYAEALARLDFYPEWSNLPPFYSEIDPFIYSGRLGVLKLLIDTLNVNGAFGEFNEMNPFWGYVFQAAWQWRSGRLQLPNTEESCIHPHSMWGYANHALSIIPLIAAINDGLIKPISIRAPYEHGVIEYAHGGVKSPYVVPEVFSEALPAWSRFFQHALQLRSGDDLEPLRFRLWQAHRKTLKAIEPTISQRGYHYHTRLELNFLFGWMRMLDFLGAAAWRTDLDYMLQHGLGVLPERLLTSDDRPGRIRNMSPLANQNIANIVDLSKQSKFRFTFNLFLWKRAMRSAQARADVLTLLDATLNPSQRNRRELRRLVRYIIAP